MTGGTPGGPELRRAAYVDERLMGGPSPHASTKGLAGVEITHDRPADHAADDIVESIRYRREQLAAYRELVRAARQRSRPRPARSARAGEKAPAGPQVSRRRPADLPHGGLAPQLSATAGGPNWMPIGPFGAMNGQAATKPVVSGRVLGIAVSRDGRRVYIAAANGGVWRSLDSGVTWDPMSDELDLAEVPEPPHPVPPAGSLRQVDTLASGAIALVEGGTAANDRLYVGTGEGGARFGTGPPTDFFGIGMLRSDDGGAHWQQEDAIPSLVGSSVYALATDPGDREHVFAATGLGIYRRTQATAGTAKPWRQEAPLGPGPAAGVTVTSVTSAVIGGQVHFYAAVQGGAIFDWTAGAWTALPALPAGSSRITLGVFAGPPTVLYAFAADGSGLLHGLHRIDPTAGGPAWSTVTSVPADVFGTGRGQGDYDQALAVDPADPDTVYIGGSTIEVEGEWSAAIYRLAVTPSGTGFSCSSVFIGASSHADVHVLVHRPGSSDELWVGCDGGVFTTDNARGSGNRLFRSCNAGLATLTLVGLGHLPGEDSYAFAGAQDNGGLRYLGSEVWDHQLYGDGGATVVDWAQPAAGATRQLLSVYVRNRIRRSDLDGRRYQTSEVKPPAARQLFYPPLVSAPLSKVPAESRTVAFGGEVPYVSGDFGSTWDKKLPDRSPPTPPNDMVRSLAFASPTRLWAGWTDGHVTRYDKTAPDVWVACDLPRPGETRPVTSIAINPAVANGDGIFVTLGGAPGLGDRVWALDSSPAGTPPQPQANWTPAGAGLLDVQHNVIVVDQADATGSRRWAGADLGAWQWNQAASTWQVMSSNLPDAAVLDMDLVEGKNILRAATYGRGVWELDLSGIPQPAIRLALRASPIDRGRPARIGAAQAGAHAALSRIDQSPDIVVDAPGSDGAYVVPVNSKPTPAALTPLNGRRDVLVSVPEAPATTRVYVTVRNRGASPGNPPVDGIRVALLIGPAGATDDDAPDPLPGGFENAVQGGTPVDSDGWHTVGIRTLDGVTPGKPGVASFNLTSGKLPPVDASEDKRFVLLALVHHDQDPFPAPGTQNPVDLVKAEPRAALLRVTAKAASGAAIGGGTGLLVPLTTALLAHRRLGDLTDQLARKVHSQRVSPGLGGFSVPVRAHTVERRVLAMAQAAQDALAGGPKANVPRNLPGFGIGQYALLGALGFELPGFTSVLAPGGGWVSDLMRRGTPDPDRSRVAVPASEFPLALAKAGLAAAGIDAGAGTAVRGFSAGLLAAVAAGVMVGPQLTDLLVQDTNRDWHRHSRSAGAAAIERYLRRRFFGGDGAPSPASWLPAAPAVPGAVWDGYVQALSDVYHLPGTRPYGFPAFEDGFDAGDAVTAVRLRNAYRLVLDDLRTSSWPAPAWWGLLTPVLLAPSIAILAARGLPHAQGFFSASGTAGERAVFELLTAGMGIGSVAPLVYSMLLWPAVDEHTEVFVTALVMGLARGALVAGALGTSGSESQSALARWLGFFAPLASLDVYAAIRGIAAGSRRPGDSTVFALQTIPAITGALTLGVGALMKALGISDDWKFWLTWSLFTGGMWFGLGIPLAVALSNGGGWRSWFLRGDRHFPLLSSVTAAGLLPAEPTAQARTYDDSTLWPDSSPGTATPADLSDYDYPSGMRGLVKVWWEGAGPLEIRYGDDLVTFRAGAVETPVRLPAGTTAASLAQLLTAALDGVKTKLVSARPPDPALPWPATLADLGDDGPVADAPIARARFVTLGTSESAALVLRHAPRADLSTPAGLTPGRVEAFPVVPIASLGDLEGTGLGAASDLAVLLTLAAAPTLGTVSVSDGLAALPDPAVHEVVQVFRRWNLDERRLAEWQSLVAGGAPRQGAPPAPPDPLVRTPPVGYAGAQTVGADLVDAMGWIPLWRAWVRIACDVGADAGAVYALPSTPLVRFADGSVRRPTNNELTDGVRFLLDLGA